MGCYTNSILAKTVEIIQMSIRNYDVSFMLYPQTYLNQEECLLLIVVVSMTSPSNRY